MKYLAYVYMEIIKLHAKCSERLNSDQLISSAAVLQALLSFLSFSVFSPTLIRFLYNRPSLGITSARWFLATMSHISSPAVHTVIYERLWIYSTFSNVHSSTSWLFYTNKKKNIDRPLQRLLFSGRRCLPVSIEGSTVEKVLLYFL